MALAISDGRALITPLMDPDTKGNMSFTPIVSSAHCTVSPLSLKALSQPAPEPQVPSVGSFTETSIDTEGTALTTAERVPATATCGPDVPSGYNVPFREKVILTCAELTESVTLAESRSRATPWLSNSWTGEANVRVIWWFKVSVEVSNVPPATSELDKVMFTLLSAEVMDDGRLAEIAKLSPGTRSRVPMLVIPVSKPGYAAVAKPTNADTSPPPVKDEGRKFDRSAEPPTTTVPELLNATVNVTDTCAPLPILMVAAAVPCAEKREDE